MELTNKVLTSDFRTGNYLNMCFAHPPRWIWNAYLRYFLRTDSENPIGMENLHLKNVHSADQAVCEFSWNLSV